MSESTVGSGSSQGSNHRNSLALEDTPVSDMPKQAQESRFIDRGRAAAAARGAHARTRSGTGKRPLAVLETRSVGESSTASSHGDHRPPSPGARRQARLDFLRARAAELPGIQAERPDEIHLNENVKVEEEEAAAESEAEAEDELRYRQELSTSSRSAVSSSKYSESSSDGSYSGASGSDSGSGSQDSGTHGRQAGGRRSYSKGRDRGHE